MELAVLAVILAAVVETWLIQGLCYPWYVEGGSMAPGLVGAHRHVVCPQCRFAFDVDAVALPDERGAECPNCQQQRIPLELLPVLPGDRLLVLRTWSTAERFKRWDLAVFRRPDRPSEFCVKRIVGLPGESIELRDGDVWVDGQLARKSLATCRQMAMQIGDARHPSGPAAAAGGKSEPTGQLADMPAGWTAASPDSRWVRQATRLICRNCDSEQIDWLEFRRPGSSNLHGTTQIAAAPIAPASGPTERSPAPDSDAAQPVSHLAAKIPADAGSGPMRPELLVEPVDGAAPDNSSLHASPLWNSSSYDPAESRQLEPVYDLLLRCRAQLDLYGTLYLRADDGRDEWLVTLAHREEGGILYRSGRVQTRFVVDRATQSRMMSGPCELEFACMDQQILLAINGRASLEFPYQRSPGPRRPAAAPLAIAIQQDNLVLSELRVFRDVDYQPVGSWSPATGSPVYHLGGTEYFLLGDNSAHSEDSRHWSSGLGVTAELIVGKPVLLSLRRQ